MTGTNYQAPQLPMVPMKPSDDIELPLPKNKDIAQITDEEWYDIHKRVEEDYNRMVDEIG